VFIFYNVKNSNNLFSDKLAIVSIFYFMITSEKHGQLVSGKKYTDTYVLCVGVNMFNRFMCDT
jgi:hypothetical protein